MSAAQFTVQVSDGANLRVWLLGGQQTTKPTLIALHSAPGLSSHAETEAAFGFLATKFRVIVYDARGSGDSDSTAPLTNDRWIADVDELRAWSAAETIVLAGGSYGAFVALDYVLAYPDRVSGLILRGAWPCGPRGVCRVMAHIMASTRIRPDAAQQVRLWSGNLRDNLDFTTAISSIAPIFGPPGEEEEVSGGGTDAADEAPAPKCHYATQNAAFGYNMPRFDVRSRLGEIKVPTLIVVGRHDVITPVEDSEELHNGIVRSELVVFEKSGHNPPSDEPDAFNEAVWAFLRKHGLTEMK